MIPTSGLASSFLHPPPDSSQKWHCTLHSSFPVPVPDQQASTLSKLRSLTMPTCRNLAGMICFPGKVNSLSTPPTSFHSISLLVGGANSSGTTRSAARRSCARIVSLGINFCSSMTNLRFFFVLRAVPAFSPQQWAHKAQLHTYTVTAFMPCYTTAILHVILIDGLSCSFTSCSTQNRSFQTRSQFPSQSLGLLWKKTKPNTTKARIHLSKSSLIQPYLCWKGTLNYNQPRKHQSKEMYNNKYKHKKT